MDVIKKDKYGIQTGYYDDFNNFILNSYDDEPAIYEYNGLRIWYKKGLLHREGDLPAYERNYGYGYKSYWEEGKLHRGNNLPAIIWGDGTVEYWLNDEPYYPTAEYTINQLKEKIGHDFKLMIEVK